MIAIEGEYFKPISDYPCRKRGLQKRILARCTDMWDRDFMAENTAYHERNDRGKSPLS